MAISYIAGAQSGGSGSTSFSITHGLTLQVGDLIVVTINDLMTGSAETMTPTGTYQCTNSRNAAGGARTVAGFEVDTTTGGFWVFHRIVTTPASETAYTFTGSDAVAYSIMAMQFRGVHADVWDVKPDTAGYATSAPTGTTATAPSITIGTAGSTALLLAGVGTGSYGNGTNGIGSTAIDINKDTVTNSYSDAQCYYMLSTGSYREQAAWYRTGMSAGAMGASACTLRAADEWVVVQASLKPAGTVPRVVKDGLVAEYVGKWAKGSGTFGYQTQGANNSSGWSDYKFGNPHTLSVDALVTKLTMYTTNVDTGHQACSARGVIYANNAGEPGAWIASTQDVSISDNLQAWKDFTFASPVHLTPGTYWLVCHGSATANGFDVRNTGSLSISRQNEDTFVGGAADPFGSSSYNGTRTHSIYATYTCAAPGNNSDPTSVWDDIKGGYDGTLSGFAYTESEGWRGVGSAADPYALAFNGGELVATADAGTVFLPSTLTVEAWARPGAGSGQQSIVCGTELWSTFGLYFRHVAGSDIGFWVNKGDGYSYGGTFSITLTYGNLCHIVGTWDGTNAIVYVDGTAYNITEGSTSTTKAGSSILRIGYCPELATPYYLTGSIATVRFYNRAISPTEVAQNYAAGPTAASTQDLSSLIAFGIC